MPGWLTPGVTQATPANYLGTMAPLYSLDTYAPAGSPETMAMPSGATLVGSFNTVTAAGATLGTATKLTAFKNIITVALTASTKGVKLPTAVTGLAIAVINAATFGVKVYAAATGQKIGANTTATTADTVLAINKMNIYVADSNTHWCVFRGS